MKKTLIFAALAAVTATLGMAAPASASPFDNINARQAQLSQQVDFGQRSGRLTFSEARGLRTDLRQIDFLEARYNRGGLNFQERADLNRRLDQVQFNLQRELNDRDHRGPGRH
ncbi:MAG: hypothetical protein ABUL73_00755 [Alphaproteobacteria bacterium]